MTPKTILIIDDEHSLLRLTQIMFQRKGYNVKVALSIKDARELLLEEGPVNLVVLDLMLPEEDGFDFLKWLDQQDDTLKKMAIIVNTAKKLSDEDQSFLDGRCKKILYKGVEFTDHLLAEVESIL